MGFGEVQQHNGRTDLCYTLPGKQEDDLEKKIKINDMRTEDGFIKVALLAQA